MGTKIKGQYMNRSIFRMIKYMNGSFFSKARYMNGIGFEILARTPVPKLPPNYPHPAPRLGEVETGSAVVGGGGLNQFYSRETSPLNLLQLQITTYKYIDINLGF